MSISSVSGPVVPSATSNTLRVPKATRRYPISTPEQRLTKALRLRDRSLEFSLYEFVLRVRAAEEGRIPVGTVQSLSSRITKIFHTKLIARFRNDQISLNADMIQELTEEFESLDEFKSKSKVISFQSLNEKGWDLHSLSQSIARRIHNAPEFFGRKMGELSELAEMSEEEKLDRKQTMDSGHVPLNITLTTPSGETQVLVSRGNLT